MHLSPLRQTDSAIKSPSGDSLDTTVCSAAQSSGTRNKPGPRARGREKTTASGRKPLAKKSRLTKAQRLALAHARRDAKMLSQVSALLSDDVSRERFSLLDTPSQRSKVAELYAHVVAKMLRRTVYFDSESTYLQPIRLLLAYCATLDVSPELFIRAQIEMLSGFFRGKKIVPKFGILISDKAVGRLEQYVAMMERSWEKKSELAEVMAGPLVRQSSVWQALEYSSRVMQNRLERVCKARDKETLTEPEVAAELEMMARAGLVSNIYVALHRLANNTEYLTSMKISTLEKLAEEAADAFYLSRIKDSFRLHLTEVCSNRAVIDWLL